MSMISRDERKRTKGLKKFVNSIPKTFFTRILGMVAAAAIYVIFFAVTYFPYYGTINIALKVIFIQIFLAN